MGNVEAINHAPSSQIRVVIAQVVDIDAESCLLGVEHELDLIHVVMAVLKWWGAGSG
jgi:hypothetical protein